MSSRLLLMIALLCPSWGYGHNLSDSFIDLVVVNQQIDGHWLIAVQDLELAIGVDQDLDTEVTWGELLQRRSAIIDYALAFSI